MIKVIYDSEPFNFDNKNFGSMALIAEKRIVLNIIENIFDSYNPSHIVIAQIKGDEKTLNSCYERLLSNNKFIYPMKPSGFLYFKNAELHVQIINSSDIKLILQNWGHFGSFELLVFQSDNVSKVWDYLQKDLYIDDNSTLKRYLNTFDIIINQSGDEGEVEILFHKKDFEKIQEKVSEFIEYHLTK